MVNTAEVPKYRLLEPFFDETHTLRDMGTIIEYEGTPNLAMQPLNEAALAQIVKLEKVLHEGARLRALQKGKEYNGALPTLEDAVGEAVAERPRELDLTPPVVKASPQTESLATLRTRGKNKVKSAVPPAAPPMQPLTGHVVNHDA